MPIMAQEHDIGGEAALLLIPVDATPFPEIDPDPLVRCERMKQYVTNHSLVCLCRLILKFQLGRNIVQPFIDAMLQSGELVLDHTWKHEPIYIRTSQTPEQKDCSHLERSQIVADIELAVGVLADVFPDYRRGQGELSSSVRRVLRSSIELLAKDKLVPPYWPETELNSSAVILTLTKVFGGRQRVVSFLSSLVEPNLRSAITETMTHTQGIESEVEAAIRILEASNTRAEHVLEKLDQG